MIFMVSKDFLIDCTPQAKIGNTRYGLLRIKAGSHTLCDDGTMFDIDFGLSHLARLSVPGIARYSLRFEGMSADAIADLFLDFIYGEYCNRLPERPVLGALVRTSVFTAFNVEGFDSLFIALVSRNEECDRFIWRKGRVSDTYEVELPAHALAHAVKSCRSWLDDLPTETDEVS